MLVASAVGLVVRLRRAEGEVRRQLLWIATSAGMLACSLFFLLVGSEVDADGQTLVTATPLFLSFALTPVCVAIAVLRHRLVDIDLIVNRALLVVIATGAVAVAYVLAVVTLGPWIGGREGCRPCSPRRSSRSPSSPCAGASCAWPTGGPTAPPPPRTTRSRTSAGASRTAPTRRSCSRRSRTRP
jgi:hypothetical protein